MSLVSEKIIKRLFAVSGNICAFPRCQNNLIDLPSRKVVGEICHIKGKSPKSARYDRAQSREERHDYANLILMCVPHHRIVDADAKLYTVEELQKIKGHHEKIYSNRQLSLSEEAVHEFLVTIESNEIKGGSIIFVNAPQSGQIAHSIINSDSRTPITYQRLTQKKFQVGSLPITTQLISKIGFVLLAIALPFIVIGVFLTSVLVLKLLPVISMMIGVGFIFVARPLQTKGYERVGSINLECTELGDLYITEIEGICPFCGSPVKLRSMPKGSSLSIMGFCERNTEMHTFSFDHTRLNGVYYPITWEKPKK